jgi:hypothetical protein
MTDPAEFKYDVRVRERMLKRGLLQEAELEKHLASLVDVEAKSENVDLGQPALGAAGDSRHATQDAARAVMSDDEREAS